MTPSYASPQVQQLCKSHIRTYLLVPAGDVNSCLDECTVNVLCAVENALLFHSGKCYAKDVLYFNVWCPTILNGRSPEYGPEVCSDRAQGYVLCMSNYAYTFNI